MLTAEEKARVRKIAQDKLVEAHRLLKEAGELADQGRFDLEFMGIVYVPVNPTEEEKSEEDWPVEIGYDEVVPGEWWMPSTC